MRNESEISVLIDFIVDENEEDSEDDNIEEPN